MQITKGIPSLFVQISSVFTGKLIATGFQFLLPIILVRILSKENYGIFLQFIMFGNVLGRIFLFGINGSLYFFFPNTDSRNRDQLFSQTYLFLLLSSFLFFILFSINRNLLIILFNNQQFINYWIPLSLYCIFFILSNGIEHQFILEKKSKNVVFFYSIDSIFRIICVYAGYWFYPNIISIFWSLTLYFFLRSIYYFFYLMKNYNISFNIFNWDLLFIKKQIKYIYPIGIGQIVDKIAKQSDNFILSANFIAADFAIYSVGKFRIPIVSLIFPSVANVIVPEISKCAASNDIERATKLWHKMIITFSLITIPMVIYAEFAAKEIIIFLFTDKYIESVNIFRVILLTFFLQILSRGTILNAFAKTKYILTSQILAVFIGLSFSLYLIPKYGVWGATISFMLSFYTSGLFQVYNSAKILKLTFYKSLPFKYIAVILIISLLISPLAILIKYVIHQPLIYLISSFMIYSILIIIIYYRINLMNFKGRVFNLMKNFNNMNM